MSSLKEREINFKDESEGSKAEPIQTHDKVNNVRNQAVKSICKVKTSFGYQGTGAIYQVVDKLVDKNRFLFMTCNHVLPTTSRIEIAQTTLEFEEIPQMANIHLSKEDILFVWTTKVLDATVIEISHNSAKLYSKYGAQFLKVGEAILNDQVALVQYPTGKLSIAHGDIERLESNDVFYRMGTESGSSGAPLLTLDCVAIGIHKAASEGSKTYQPNLDRKATSLIAILNVFLREYLEIQNQTITLKDQLVCLRYLFSKSCTY